MASRHAGCLAMQGRTLVVKLAVYFSVVLCTWKTIPASDMRNHPVSACEGASHAKGKQKSKWQFASVVLHCLVLRFLPFWKIVESDSETTA